MAVVTSLVLGWMVVAAQVADVAAGDVAVAEPGSTVKAWLASGRVFSGDLGAKTDGSTLWLSRQRGAMLLERPILWDRVEKVEIAGHRMAGADLQKIVVQVRKSLPSGPETIPPGRRWSTARPSPAVAAPVPHITEMMAEQLPVSSLLLDVAVVNWDSDVETDGLLLRDPAGCRGASCGGGWDFGDRAQR